MLQRSSLTDREFPRLLAIEPGCSTLIGIKADGKVAHDKYEFSTTFIRLMWELSVPSHNNTCTWYNLLHHCTTNVRHARAGKKRLPMNNLCIRDTEMVRRITSIIHAVRNLRLYIRTQSSSFTCLWWLRIRKTFGNYIYLTKDGINVSILNQMKLVALKKLGPHNSLNKWR